MLSKSPGDVSFLWSTSSHSQRVTYWTVYIATYSRESWEMKETRMVHYPVITTTAILCKMSHILNCDGPSQQSFPLWSILVWLSCLVALLDWTMQLLLLLLLLLLLSLLL